MILSLSLSLFVNEYFYFIVANIIIAITPTDEESVGVNLLQGIFYSILKYKLIKIRCIFFKSLLFCLFYIFNANYFG